VTETAQTTQFDLQAVLDVFRSRTDQARPLTANDVMEALGCSRRTAHNKLNDLVDRDRLATRKVGARSRVWWVPLSGTGTPGDAAAAAALDGEADRELAVEAEIAAVDLRGDDGAAEARRDALRAAYDYLSDHPDASESAFLTEVFPRHPADFERADEWWAVIRPALRELPDVDVGEEREHVWHYIGG
jgi:hypothetical protein